MILNEDYFDNDIKLDSADDGLLQKSYDYEMRLFCGYPREFSKSFPAEKLNSGDSITGTWVQNLHTKIEQLRFVTAFMIEKETEKSIIIRIDVAHMFAYNTDDMREILRFLWVISDIKTDEVVLLEDVETGFLEDLTPVQKYYDRLKRFAYMRFPVTQEIISDVESHVTGICKRIFRIEDIETVCVVRGALPYINADSIQIVLRNKVTDYIPKKYITYLLCPCSVNGKAFRNLLVKKPEFSEEFNMFFSVYDVNAIVGAGKNYTINDILSGNDKKSRMLWKTIMECRNAPFFSGYSLARKENGGNHFILTCVFQTTATPETDSTHFYIVSLAGMKEEVERWAKTLFRIPEGKPMFAHYKLNT